nr:SpvB/TcaC N-terminal domain-containing protein [Frankia sp. Cr2]
MTGTGSLTIPLPVSPGRSGFGPSLALSYDSGAAQGPFGLGWTLGLPSVTRKTDKGLPTYDDATESDVFLLSGAEDLVPILDTKDVPASRLRTVDGTAYRIVRYRPRIEGLHARIERWTAVDGAKAGQTHWRSISRDNITTVYGKDDNSRIADPADTVHRVFSWLICESYDAKGNAIAYRYAEEDSRDVDRTAAHERHRTQPGPLPNRYLKAVRYGNRVSRLIQPVIPDGGWLFELVFDYGEHDQKAPTALDAGVWPCRNDPFSSYRPGFEVRTYRLCQRVLMFHHFPDEPAVGRDCLVRSMSLTYQQNRPPAEDHHDDKRGHPAGALLASVTVAGHRRDGVGGYAPPTVLPPLELTYSSAKVGGEVHEIDADSLANLPVGLDGTAYQWVDLDGESISGMLTEQAGAWFYTANRGDGRFAPTRTLPTQPSTPLGGGRTQLLDLAGDGQLDLVSFDGPLPGFFERTTDLPDGHGERGQDGWAPHRTIRSLPALDWADPNLRFVDLGGDGHADVLLTCDDSLVWYPSLGEDGFGPAIRVSMPADDAAGPRLVFADGTGSIYLADMSGDGLADLVRVRNGEVCYWPNLGYGRFGAQVVMDDSPLFDRAELFDQRRLRLADVDGTGPTDLVYLGAAGVDLYRNQMGNSWTPPARIPAFPPVDDVTSVSVVDLLGRGTACLVWSSPLPGDARRQVRYVDLMGDKPHLLVGVRNNLGAETAVHYTTSTAFYLADQAAGRPWVTRLPFPVHVVEKVETFDRVNRNRFVTRYAYHHGYFDGHEREFRGFGMVEQFDTEHLAALRRNTTFPVGDNEGAATHLPPVLTRTWFHTGAYVDRQRLSALFADEYYPPPEHPLPAAAGWQLPDTVLDPGLFPAGLSLADEREACRALKGQLLRQEVYALDGTDREPHPYTVVEHSYTVVQPEPRQSAGGDDPDRSRHGVFAVQPRETLTVTCERDPSDPRIAHEVVLEVDDYGTVTHSVALAYRRAAPAPPPHPPRLALPARTVAAQSTTLVTETRVDVTNVVDRDVDDPLLGTPRPVPAEWDAFRVPVGYDSRTYQLTSAGFDAATAVMDRATLNKELEKLTSLDRRLLDRARTRFLRDDLASPLDWGAQDPRGLPHEAYRLVLTPEILTAAYGTRVNAAMLADAGYVTDGGEWWAPSGTVRYAPAAIAASDVHRHAAEHFFQPRRFVDPFAATTHIEYDDYDLLSVEVVDAVGNLVTAGERNVDDARLGLSVDYRVLAPTLVTDPNRNRVAVAYDALGLVVATAVMGKPQDDTGDRVDPTTADLAGAVVTAFWADPLGLGPNPAPGTTARELLGDATTRVVYDLHAYQRTAATGDLQPPGAATIAREQHVAAASAAGAGPSRLQVGFGYSDGTGREIQRKAQAEPGPLVDGGPVVSPRWVGSGWTVYNNKGKPVRQYEPFFTATHRFEFKVIVGVSPVLCYDPPGRVVATLHPDHTWDKVVVGAWQQETWDVNDTAALPDAGGLPAGNPADDPDIAVLARVLPEADYLPTWYQRRTAAHLLTAFGDLAAAENTAARRAGQHASTPTLACLDPLGRPILTVARNRTPGKLAADLPADTEHRTHVQLDIKGSQLAVRDCTDATPALVDGGSDRLVARYTYDLAGARLVDESMEAGTHRSLADVAGKPVHAWDPVERRVTTVYDTARRPISATLLDPAPLTGGKKIVGRTVYGEGAPDAATDNLRGKVWQVRDGAGIVMSSYDVAGNPTSVTRQLTRGYRDVVDWTGTVDLETDVWTTSAEFDALGRPELQTLPDGTVVRPAYNEAGLLESVQARLADDTADTVFVVDVDYDAKGQRTRVEHGNGVVTVYDYDRETFRLRHLNTVRPASFTEDEPVPPDQRRSVQDLRYVYDPTGNITHIRDDAQPRAFNLNVLIEASGDYVYDALYRLVEARGREHLGVANGQEPATSWNDAPRANLPNAADRQALARYDEYYDYDAAGNMTKLVHEGTAPGHPGWTRTFTCKEWSQLEPPLAPGESAPTAPNRVYSNRLSSTQVGAGLPEVYSYDVHGNMLTLPPMEFLRWNYLNQLTATSRQSVTSGVPETTYYVYDGTGERIRKLTAGSAARAGDAKLVKERIYLGAFEIYREYGNNTGAVALARTTVHITDGTHRVAMVETRTDAGAATDPNPQLTRYQYANHLGSATVELDPTAILISYEEYYPYGGTALSFTRSGAPPKRYRYTAKERDEETGLNYHSARYYAPWLARWLSCDPLGFADGVNLYTYGRANSLNRVDPMGAKSRYPADAPLAPKPAPAAATDTRPLAPASSIGRGFLNEQLAKYQKSLLTDVTASTSFGRDLRFGIEVKPEAALYGPIESLSRYMLSPSQLRNQWGQSVDGYRIDRESSLRISGSPIFVVVPAARVRWDPVLSLELGTRTSNASGRIAQVENQTVGYARIGVGEHARLEYYNDHRFLWWPMGDGGDQGNTAGVRITAEKLSAHLLRAGNTEWRIESVGAHLRLASGIPDRKKTVNTAGRTFYRDVAFGEISQGILSASVTARSSTGWGVTLEGGLNRAGIRDVAQNQLVHRNLGIPEFMISQPDEAYVSLGISKHF